MNKIPVSVLDLALVTEGSDIRGAIERSVQLAQHIEREGFRRLWLAEHHNMANIASASTSLLIGHMAGKTKSLTIGSGGIMLPNHSPLSVAEQFGTLDALYPGRIELGLGRAPGTDQATAYALRRHFGGGEYDFKAHIEELLAYMENTDERKVVRAFPGEGAKVPIWILGSSTDSAFLAAEMGLPYAFAAHFAPTYFKQAVKIYRQYFRPSTYLSQPKMMACVNMVAAETVEEAQYLASSIYRLFLGIITNNRIPLPPPTEDLSAYLTPEAQAAVAQMTAYTFIGNPERLRKEVEEFIQMSQVDELMVTSNIYDSQKRLESFSLFNKIWN